VQKQGYRGVWLALQAAAINNSILQLGLKRIDLTPLVAYSPSGTQGNNSCLLQEVEKAEA